MSTLQELLALCQQTSAAHSARDPEPTTTSHSYAHLIDCSYHIMYSCLCTFCPCLLLDIHSILLYFYSSVQLYGCKCLNKLSSVQFSSQTPLCHFISGCLHLTQNCNEIISHRLTLSCCWLGDRKGILPVKN